MASPKYTNRSLSDSFWKGRLIPLALQPFFSEIIRVATSFYKQRLPTTNDPGLYHRKGHVDTTSHLYIVVYTDTFEAEKRELRRLRGGNLATVGVVLRKEDQSELLPWLNWIE
jgi:hypothetical protein